MSITAVKDVATVLSLMLDDGDGTKFPQAFVFDSGGTPVGAAQDLAHVSLGLYTKAFTFTAIGDFDVVYEVFNEAGHTTESALHPRGEDKYQVMLSALTAEGIADVVLREILTDHSSVAGSLAEAMVIVKGLVHEFYMLDSTIYDSTGLMTAARIRIFPDAATLGLATDGGSAEGDLFSFTVAATPDLTAAGQPATVKITRP